MDSLPPHLLGDTLDNTREERELRETLQEIAQSKEKDLIEHCIAQIRKANRLKEEESTFATQACEEAARDIKKSREEKEQAESRAVLMGYDLATARDEIERLRKEVDRRKQCHGTTDRKNIRNSTHLGGNLNMVSEENYGEKPPPMNLGEIPKTSSPTSPRHKSMNAREYYRDYSSLQQQRGGVEQSRPMKENLGDAQTAASYGILEIGKMMEALLDRTNADLTRSEKLGFKETMANIISDQTQAINRTKNELVRTRKELDYQPLTQVYQEPPQHEWPEDLPSTRSYGISTFEGNYCLFSK